MKDIGDGIVESGLVPPRLVLIFVKGNMVCIILSRSLNFTSHLEKSLNSAKVLEKYLISLLGLKKPLKFTTLSMPTTPFSGLLIICAVADPRNSGISAKFREIPQNPPEIFPNTCWQNIFNTYLGY